MAKQIKPLGTRNTAEHVGDCVVCKHGIFSYQEHGRAQRPLIGKVHKWCGGVPS